MFDPTVVYCFLEGPRISEKTAFQWLFYLRPLNFTGFLVEGTRTFLERPFSLFWVTFLLTCYRLYFFSRGRYTHVLSTNCTVIIHLLSCFPEGIQVFRDIFRLILTFSRRYSYFFRNENNKIMWEDFTSSICWLRSKMIFFMKMNSNIFAYFTSSICSLRRHFCIFYLEYLLITSAFLHILPRISAHFIHKILNSRNSEWETRVLRHPSGRKRRLFLRFFLTCLWLYAKVHVGS